MLFGIRDILIISTPEDTPRIEQLLGDGSSLGLNLSYAVQEEPKGIAQALLIGKDFIKGDQVCLILGDNIFYMGEQLHQIVDKLHSTDNNVATIFAYHVSNPQRFGVVEFNSQMQVISIEEKPQRPKSNYVSVGLYFYPPDAADKAASLKPSKRGELEITDLNNLYLKESRLSVIPMLRGNAWLDAGTPDSLMDSGDFVRIIEQRQGLKIACLEEIALKQGFIDKQQLLCLIERLDECNYKTYLQKVYLDELEIY